MDPAAKSSLQTLMSPGQRKATSAKLCCGTIVSISMLGLLAKPAGTVLAQALSICCCCSSRGSRGNNTGANSTHPCQDQYLAKDREPPLVSLGLGTL